MKKLALLSVLFLSGCLNASGKYQDYLRLYGLPEPSLENFVHCYDYGCKTKVNVALPAATQQRLKQNFMPIPQNAEAERLKISTAIKIFEDDIGAMTGTANDKRGTFRLYQDSNKKYDSFQQDCTDESTNTTIYLGLLEKMGLLQFHRPIFAASRQPFVTGVPWWHQTAAVENIHTGEKFAVDSWSVIMAMMPLLSLWMNGKMAGYRQNCHQHKQKQNNTNSLWPKRAIHHTIESLKFGVLLMMHTYKYILSLILITGVLAACGVRTDWNQQTANHIARPAFMVERFIPAGNFQLQAWERMHSPGQVATVYIEGDGVRQTKVVAKELQANVLMRDPTPDNPVALHLASRDQSKNLAYLARPCQYIKLPQGKGCAASYWREARYAPEVISAYETALDEMAARYELTGFHLVGYDGGANIAAVLAAHRPDVLSLRTVAGDLNPDFTADHTKQNNLSANSVLAVDLGSKLSNVPQHHFIGAADAVITPGVYHSYRQMVGLSECIHYSLVQDADHTRGWVEKWPELLKLQPQCATVHEELPPLPPPPTDIPGNYHKSYSK